jgi:hypothetical protein
MVKKIKKPIKKTQTKKTRSVSAVKPKTKVKKKIKLTAGPLTEAQIRIFLEHYKKNKNFPGSKIACNVTGKLVTCTGPWMRKKIEEYGSPENLLRKYRCKGANKKAKLLIKGVSARKKKIKQKRKDEEGNYIIPSMPSGSQRPISKAEMTEMSKSICMRPDIFLNNGRHCEGCMHFDLCINNIKCKADPKKRNQEIAPRIRMFTSRKTS